ncbi:MAG: Acetyl-coenzyme A carboxylase carboxyl transferase subunit alpha [Alphaproteobacteria bacterium MarineAlpha4_Bin2]|nr:MAG: Acetyl-coenzyme A carboxylase carboxyl transferase subunit alpha [Alphaproteobacteria bacterium MarineAlpha4_Bin2]
MRVFLDFEQPIAELESKIEELRHLSDNGGVNIADEVSKLQGKADHLLRSIYKSLTPWQKVLVARHPERPHFRDYVAGLLEEYTPFAGDRSYADDKAIEGGIARFRGLSCVVIGHEKGSDTNERVYRNFGMARPEGYRKAQRLISFADRFGLPILTFVDTPGAYPGIGAEERGQAEAIAASIDVCLKVRVPIVSVVIGEGGSGGAIALATANHSVMLEHSIYSVISPEGCASILWRSADKAQAAAEALRLTAQDLHELDLIDEVVPEPLGGAHRNPSATVATLGNHINTTLDILLALNGETLRQRRREKFLSMGKTGMN